MRCLKSNRGAVLAYVLVILMAFLSWFHWHIRYTYEYIRSKEYIQAIRANLIFEREVLQHIKHSEIACPVDFKEVSFKCNEDYIEVIYQGVFWFTYEIRSALDI
jgi:regulatory protein YycH of two-component signal transduction system YycFG